MKTPKKEEKKEQSFFDEDKFSAMKITSSIKKRHQGLIEEI